MPQKRNPDAAELVRAKTGRVIGALTGLLIVMKGLPLAYQKDMQEDKQGAMEAFAALSLAIRAMTGMVIDLVPDEARMKAAAGEGYATATDLADWLVRTLKMPFRDAHHVTGRIVGLASKQGVALHELPLKAMQEVEPKITAEALARAIGGSLGQKPDQLWRHRAEERRGAGQSLAEAAGKRAKIGLRAKISLQFHGYPSVIRSRQSRAIFVWCGRVLGIFVVISNYRPTSSGWAIIVLSVTALALGGCGRKGRPRSAAERVDAAARPRPRPPIPTAERAAQPGVFNPTYGSDAAAGRRPRAARNRSFSIRCWQLSRRG